MKPYTLIVAATKTLGIGIGGGLPWRLPKDMAFFKHVTTLIPTNSPEHLQNVVIMGRVTWESIPPKFRPLAGRFNIVISRNPDYDLQGAPNTVLVDSLEKALSLVDDERHGRVFVIGGAHMYRLAMGEKHCSHILMTRIESNIECDTFFPAINDQEFHRASHQELETYVEQVVPQGIQTHKDLEYEFLLYVRS
ncbi:dihydrofolate reductase [Absidia repens]|uniref:Dihydrofolate reductase n=1 Tax=Absidia repens TaxID=90262 RepID=A0A1X2I272_9FUNG|nr:dihydrofolate reductase [Absidia repens]